MFSLQFLNLLIGWWGFGWIWGRVWRWIWRRWCKRVCRWRGGGGRGGGSAGRRAVVRISHEISWSQAKTERKNEVQVEKGEWCSSTQLKGSIEGCTIEEVRLMPYHGFKLGMICLMKMNFSLLCLSDGLTNFYIAGLDPFSTWSHEAWTQLVRVWWAPKPWSHTKPPRASCLLTRPPSKPIEPSCRRPSWASRYPRFPQREETMRWLFSPSFNSPKTGPPSTMSGKWVPCLMANLYPTTCMATVFRRWGPSTSSAGQRICQGVMEERYHEVRTWSAMHSRVRDCVAPWGVDG